MTTLGNTCILASLAGLIGLFIVVEAICNSIIEWLKKRNSRVVQL